LPFGRIEPNQPKKDSMTIFEEYLTGKSYNEVTEKLIKPWMDEMNKNRWRLIF
jgi:hypothetical protein